MDFRYSGQQGEMQVEIHLVEFPYLMSSKSPSLEGWTPTPIQRTMHHWQCAQLPLMLHLVLLPLQTDINFELSGV